MDTGRQRHSKTDRFGGIWFVSDLVEHFPCDIANANQLLMLIRDR